jgi:hypothetical protein
MEVVMEVVINLIKEMELLLAISKYLIKFNKIKFYYLNYNYTFNFF